jgi:signal transduction histidine kinase
MENTKISLTHRVWAKVLAVIALALFTASTLLFAGILVVADDIGAYEGFFNPSGYSAGVARAMAVTVYQLRYWGIPLLLVSLAAAASCLVFLFYSAGHRGESDRVRLGWFDKIPLDLLLAALGFTIVFAIQVAVEWSWNNTGVSLLMIDGACALVGGLLLLAALMTVAVRVKVGGGVWWRNTVIFRGLHLLWRWCGSVCRWLVSRWNCVSQRLPIIWRTVLIAGGLIFLDMLLAALAFSGNGFVVLLWVAYNALIFLALCFGGWQMRSIKTAGEKLAEGELDYTVDTTHMYWEFKRHAENLNSIGEGMGAAVERGMKSERLKTELITNVSHDIKTPLTSIVNYVDLLEKAHTPEQEAEYLAVLDRQSKRLKKLTEDLVEASKASTGNMTVNLVPTNVGEIINQSLAEYTERLTAGKLESVVTVHAPSVVSVLADGRLLWRVLDNLFSNVCKYALAGTRVYVDVWVDGERATVAVKNISRAPLNLSADELMERFVRGDSSRSTEGSGLGLSIARSLVELQKGSFTVSTDGDLFKAEIILPLA